MRTTIDGAGRLVIPKALRDAAGLHGGSEVEVELRDGRIEVEPAGAPMRLVTRDGHTFFESAVEMPPITDDDVRGLLERLRR